MTPTTMHVAVLALVLAGSASASPASIAADVAGAWTMSYTTRDGVKMTSTLTLKIEADKLTGTISSPRGSIALDEVSVNGDDIAFAIIRVGFGDRIRIEYTGKVKGDTMTLKMKVGAREPIDVTAKRQEKAAMVSHHSVNGGSRENKDVHHRDSGGNGDNQKLFFSVISVDSVVGSMSASSVL